MDNRLEAIQNLQTTKTGDQVESSSVVAGPSRRKHSMADCLRSLLSEERKGGADLRDYFIGVINAVADMVILANGKGRIVQVNEAGCKRLGYLNSSLIDCSMDILTGKGRPSLFRQVIRQRGPEGVIRIWDRSFVTSSGDRFPVGITGRVYEGEGGNGVKGILIMARDSSKDLSLESRIQRAAIAVQEQERARLARDLHEGLGQQLSAVKFLISAVMGKSRDPMERERLEAANRELARILGIMRGICYDLMPKSIEESGLALALRELADQVALTEIARIGIEEGADFPCLPKAMQIDLFRVIQEFVHNAIRHGEATHILVRLEGHDQTVEVQLKENGKGFVPALVSGRGMGLRNMYDRILSHGGTFILNSSLGKGTEATIRLVTK